MKKINSILLAAALLTSSFVYANGTSLNDYYSTLHPQRSVASLKAPMHPITDITVVNASSSYIYAVVPNSPINDLVNAGYNDHIYNNDPNIWYTTLVLQDPYRSSFYSATVCRLAI